MNKLSIYKRAQIIGMLVENYSMRTVSRMADCSINTVTKLLVDVGTACSLYQYENLRNLPCTTIQCDEIWSFCYSKEKNVPGDRKGEFGVGDVYTWTAMCADTKLVPSFMIGKRDASYGNFFIQDLADRLSNRVQLTTDGHKLYLQTVENSFGSEIDCAMQVRIYAKANQEDEWHNHAEYAGTKIVPITGLHDETHVSTSYVERQDLAMRMKHFTKLTNGFSKKINNLYYAIALHFMYYNFGKIHKTLRVTPAMAAEVSDHVWSLEEIVSL